MHKYEYISNLSTHTVEHNLSGSIYVSKSDLIGVNMEQQTIYSASSSQISMRSAGLSEDDTSAYSALYARLSVASSKIVDEEREVGALEFTFLIARYLNGLELPCPGMFWSDMDSVILFWSDKNSLIAITIVDGEFALLKKRGKIEVYHAHSFGVMDLPLFECLERLP